jgi:hypothetical protein
MQSTRSQGPCGNPPTRLVDDCTLMQDSSTLKGNAAETPGQGVSIPSLISWPPLPQCPMASLASLRGAMSPSTDEGSSPQTGQSPSPSHQPGQPRLPAPSPPRPVPPSRSAPLPPRGAEEEVQSPTLRASLISPEDHSTPP